MDLYVIRHADAGDRKTWTADDSERPLSPRGHDQSKALGEALKRRGIVLNAMVSSPLVRTHQTAEGVLAAWPPSVGVTVSNLLAPGELRRKKLAKHLASLAGESIAIVGHDPDLPAFLGWLLGVDPEHVPMEKGGAACVHFEDEPGKGDGVLGWLIEPGWYMTGS